MLTNPKVNDSSLISSGFEITSAFNIRIIRDAQISRASNQSWHVGSECIDYFSTGSARCHRLCIGEIRKMTFPSLRQFTTHSLMPGFAQVAVVLYIFRDQIFPVFLQLIATFDRLTKMI